MTNLLASPKGPKSESKTVPLNSFSYFKQLYPFKYTVLSSPHRFFSLKTSQSLPVPTRPLTFTF